MIRLKDVFSVFVLASFMALPACEKPLDIASTSGAGSQTGKAPVSFTRFPDLPIPVKAEIDMDQTIIFGADEDWFGRLVINTPHDTNEMFDYFKQEMKGFGWREITTIRAAASVLTYSRNNRIATIQIQGGALQGSETSITVSPEGAPLIPEAPPSLIPQPLQRAE